jgi:hypothetical protein
MNTLEPKAGEQVVDVRVTEESLIVDLADGRSVSVPLAWYPRLLNASPEQRNRWETAGAGFGIHWPEIDEDLSVQGILLGIPAPGVRVPLRSAG